MAKKYVCTYEGCKSSFPRPSKLAVHMLLHEGKIPFPCDIEGCDRGYTTRVHLKRHQSIHHECTSMRVTCTVEECNKEFSNDANLKKHIERAHNPDRVYSYPCIDCDLTFPKKRLLNQHMYLHTGKFHYICDKCQQGFHLLSELNNHKRTHSLYKCQHCNVTMESFSQLRRHNLSHKKLYKCPDCNYATYEKFRWVPHQETHKPSQERLQFECPYQDCTKSYLHSRNLKMHINSFHKGKEKKKISCSIEGCSAQLSHMASLKQHIAKVHNEGTQAFKRPRKVRKDCGKSKASIIARLIGQEVKDDPDVLLESKNNVLDELYQQLVKTW